MADDQNVDRMIQMVAEQSIEKSSLVLSKTLRAGARIDLRKVSMTDIAQATEAVNSRNIEVIATFIDLVGDAPFKFLFCVSTKDAMTMTDLMLRKEVGSSKEVDMYVQGTVQEIGNIISSAVTNVFVGNFNISMKPTPPIVLHEYLGTLFAEFVMGAGSETDKILLIESVFQIVSHRSESFLYLLPEPGSEKLLSFSTGA